MILLLPLPGDEDETPRTPPVTLGLIAVNVAVFMLVSGGDAHAVAEREARLERVAEWSLRQPRDAHADLDQRAQRFTSVLAFLDSDNEWPGEVESAALRERLDRCLSDYRALRASHPLFRHGFVPAEPGAWRLFAHQFLHADLLHLGFNMLFLWAVGGLVELVIGPWLFLGGYLASGVVAALAHAAANPTSHDPAIGASGAVAGVMGLLAALYGARRLRLVLVAMLATAPRILFFSVPAWVFIGLWVLEQVFFASFGSTLLGVAFGAHLGGFAFGCAAGLVGRRALTLA